MSTTSAIRVPQALFPAARSLLLGLLYGSPTESFYLREIITRTGLGVGHVQRELARLVAGGIVRRWEEDRHVYFQADAMCPVFQELRSLVEKTLGLAEFVRQALLPLARRIDAAWLHGSEVVVVGTASLAELERALRSVEDGLRRHVEPVLCTGAEARERLAPAPEKILLLGEDQT